LAALNNTNCYEENEIEEDEMDEAYSAEGGRKYIQNFG
jgi:hypothetical protein